MKVGFIDFLEDWNTEQNMKTPSLHLKMAEWLERQWVLGKTRLLLMAFRSAGKSTIVGVFAAWLLYRNPNIRILVLAADIALAKKMVRNVKRIIEAHPSTKSLKPKRADQWANDFFTVTRDLELRDPSMLARGVTSNITGSRADVVICDDVEVPNTCDTEGKREELRNRLREMAYILVAGGTQIYVGTPHHYYSIYADMPRSEIGEEEIFLGGFERLSLPIIDEKGMSAWPERYDYKEIERIKRETGQNKFDSQMMLHAINILDSRLDLELLQYYNCHADYSVELDRMFFGHMKMVRAAGFWDPSMGHETSDGSVFAVVFADEGGNYYVHHVSYIKVRRSVEETEVDQQCKIVADIARRMKLRRIGVEGNSVGKAFFAGLRKEIGRGDCSVFEVYNSKNKIERILGAFEGLMAMRRLYIHEDVRKTPFLMEMREWNPKKDGRDDGLDAVAGALLMMPDTISKVDGAGGWVKGGRLNTAKTDFDVL